jgi:hypothetical protein
MDIRMVIAAAGLAVSPAFALAASPIEGTWMVVNDDKSLDLASLVSFKVSQETVEMTAASGLAYKARLNGADAKLRGDINGGTVSVTMPRKNVLLEVTKRDGKPWLSMRMEVDADGKAAKVTWKNLRTDKGGGYGMARQ